MVLEGDLGAGLAGALDVAHGLGGLVGQGELSADPVEHHLAEFGRVAFPNLVDQGVVLGVLKGHEFAGHHHLEGLGLADEAGQASGAAGPGEHTEVDLGQADLAAVLAGDADVRGHGDFETAADSVAVDGRDDDLRRLLEARQGFVGVKAEVVLEAGRDAVEHLDGRAGGEKLLTGTGDDDGRDLVVEAGSDDGLVEITEHAVRVGVHRGRVALKRLAAGIGGKFDDGNAVVGGAVIHEVVGHRFEGQAVEVGHDPSNGRVLMKQPQRLRTASLRFRELPRLGFQRRCGRRFAARPPTEL